MSILGGLKWVQNAYMKIGYWMLIPNEGSEMGPNYDMGSTMGHVMFLIRVHIFEDRV